MGKLRPHRDQAPLPVCASCTPPGPHPRTLAADQPPSFPEAAGSELRAGLRCLLGKPATCPGRGSGGSPGGGVTFSTEKAHSPEPAVLRPRTEALTGGWVQRTGQGWTQDIRSKATLNQRCDSVPLPPPWLSLRPASGPGHATPGPGSSRGLRRPVGTGHGRQCPAGPSHCEGAVL